MARKHHYYNKYLRTNANVLRKHSTETEIILWKNLLRARGLKGYQFYRQRPLDKYIVDFICKDLKLVIEVDGESHSGRNILDKFRQRKIEDLGYTVIRFDGFEIYEDFDIVKRILENWIEEYEIRHPEIRKYSVRNSYSLRSSKAPSP